MTQTPFGNARIADLDALPADAFIEVVGPLFEGASRFLRRLADARPFGDAATLFERAEEIARELPEDEAIELVNAHPRLGAPPGSVSPASFGEQGYDTATPIEFELHELNAAYEAAFGFRYCVFVNGRPRAELIPEFRSALAQDREDELRRGAVAAVRIARDRYRRATEEARA
ncbi:MAG: 2-oxo-4-hydroxy-4-carboxy-5-ureidoimidazoline decarboxylase [Chloroflexota bacterium]|jgi:2-oxo-4-hydroxy-4-carboxy--5-ureidoimidazoline (OHCU) decarboxylase